MNERTLYVISNLRGGYAYRPAEMLFEMGHFIAASGIECSMPERMPSSPAHVWKLTFETDAGLMAFKMNFQDQLTEWPLPKPAVDITAATIRYNAYAAATKKAWTAPPKSPKVEEILQQLREKHEKAKTPPPPPPTTLEKLKKRFGFK